MPSRARTRIAAAAATRIATLLSALACAPAVVAQEPLDAVRARARELEARGDAAAAAATWEAARQEAEQRQDLRGVAICEFALADLWRARADFGRALPHALAALRTLQTIHTGDDPNVAMGLTRAGECQRAVLGAKQALPNCEAAAEMSRRLFPGGHAVRALAVYNLGLCQQDLGRFAQARSAYAEALDLVTRFDPANETSLLRCLKGLGASLYALGDFEEALARSESVLAMLVRLHPGDHPDVASALNNTGACLVSLRRHELALERMRASLAMGMRLQPGDHEKHVVRQMNIAMCLLDMMQFDAALRTARDAMAMWERMGAPEGPQTLSVVQDFSLCCTAAGHKQESLAWLEVAVAMAQRVAGDEGVLARCLRDCGTRLAQLGRGREGLPLLEESLQMYRRLRDGDHRDVVVGLRDLSSCLFGLDQREEAQAAVADALAMARRLSPGDSLDVARCLEGLAACCWGAGQTQAAVAHGRAALAMWRRMIPGDHPDTAQALLHLGCFLLEAHEDVEAVATAESALSMYQRLFRGDHPDVAMAASRLGEIQYRAGCDLEATAATLAAAIAAHERLRRAARGMSAQDRASYMSALRYAGDCYRTMRRVHARLGRPEAAFACAESGRARMLLDLLAAGEFDALAETGRRAAAAGDDATAAEVRRVRSQLDDANAALGRVDYELARIAADRALSAAERSRQQDRLAAEAVSAREGLERALRGRARLVADAERVGAPASASELQAILAPGELLLLWALDDAESHLFVVAPAGPIELVPLAGTRSEAAAAVAGLRWDMIGRAEREGEAPARTDARAFARSVLPEAVWQRVRAARRVFVVPDGALHRLPLETLVVGERDGGPVRWIDDGPPIAYVASASVLAWLRQRAAARRETPAEFELLALGDPRFRSDASLRGLPERGALVHAVSPGSQAERLGIQRQDVVVAYDGRPLADDAELRAAIAALSEAVGRGTRDRSPVPVRVLRDGAEIAFAAAPGPLGVQVAPGPAGAAFDAGFGQSLAELMAHQERNGGRGPFRELEPLPGTRDEVAAIAATFANGAATPPVRTLLGADASEANVFALSPKARYLHFATHGLVDESEAASFSALALATPRSLSSADDGFLKLSDLLTQWGMRLPGCRMVVLSACRTNVGPQARDEAPQALPMGFLYAGASSVVASLWMVPDETTARLMADFYARIRAQGPGPDRLRALYEAKKALRAAYPNPYYWAAFVYVGNPD